MTYCQNPIDKWEPANRNRGCPNSAEREYTDTRGKLWNLCLCCYLNTLTILDARPHLTKERQCTPSP